MELTILHLYPEFMSLYGEYANLAVLRRHLEALGVTVSLRAAAAGEAPDFAGADMIYMGAGTERGQKRAMEGLLPHRGEDHPPARPLKEGDPQLLLQLLDLHGDGGLSVAQVLRRPLVAALVHHGQQGAQIFQLHGDSSNH